MNEDNYLSYIMEYYKTLKRKEMLAFLTTWMKLEGVILSERRQIDKDKCFTVSLTCERLKKKMSQTYRNRNVEKQFPEAWSVKETGESVKGRNFFYKMNKV